MSTAYTPTPTHRTTVTLPENSDDVEVEAVIGVALAQLKDECAYLRGVARVTEGTHFLKLATASSRAGIWGYGCVLNGGTYESGLIQDVVTGTIALHAEVEIDLPVGTVVTNVAGWFYGAFLVADHSSLPAVLPGIKVFSVDDLQGTTTLVGDGGPISPASPGDYNTGGNESNYVGPFTIAAGKRYFVRVEGESGANSVASACRCTSIRLTRSGP